jgi:hypothetical protein
VPIDTPVAIGHVATRRKTAAYTFLTPLPESLYDFFSVLFSDDLANLAEHDVCT